jgi:hypothetical protein
MNTEQIKTTIRENAIELSRLNARIHETFKERDQGDRQFDQWSAVCEEFHARYNTLAFPGGYDGALDRIHTGDKFTIEAALCFLEVRPYFFRSGYMYKDILRRLKRSPLSEPQRLRLDEVLRRLEAWRAGHP